MPEQFDFVGILTSSVTHLFLFVYLALILHVCKKSIYWKYISMYIGQKSFSGAQVFINTLSTVLQILIGKRYVQF